MDNKKILEDMDICIAGDCYYRRCSFFSKGKDCQECMTELIKEAQNNLKELTEENEKLKADNLLFYQEQIKDKKKIESLKIRVNSIYGKREGRWKGAGMGDYYCSLCCSTYSGGNEFNYCPNCSAKMRDTEETK